MNTTTTIDILFNVGVSHLWRFEFDNAILYFGKVLAMVPKHRAALEYMGWIAAFQGQYQQALELFRVGPNLKDANVASQRLTK